jgi:hypothetical protein
VDGPHAGSSGTALVDDARYTAMGTQAIAGDLWTKIQMDSTRDRYGNLWENQYNVDLHDSLFVPGDTVWFFFGASGGLPASETNYWSEFTGAVDDIAVAATTPMEFTSLPAAGWIRGGDILYVDGADGSGAQLAFDTAFQALGLTYYVDRYDQRGPEIGVNNGPASRVANIDNQILGCYNRIVWSTGTIRFGPGDGGYSWNKSDDMTLLYRFVRKLEWAGGLYLNGDDFADHWNSNLGSPNSYNLRNQYINFDYAGNLGGNPIPRPEISALVVGEPGTFFADGPPDTLVAFGGCPDIRDFDVVNATGLSTQEMSYYAPGSGTGAVVSQRTANTNGDTVGVVLSGFGLDAVHDDHPETISDAVVHLDRILRWLGNRIGTGVVSDVPEQRNMLYRNFPNPFNPTTTISYSLRETSAVSLRVYDVSGRLVRTLVDDVMPAGAIHQVVWDGRNSSGAYVASGVYFYRLSSSDYTNTYKMVLLK